MNLLGLVTFLRTNILDDTGGIGVDWPLITRIDDSAFQLRWTNEELVDNINEAILQVYRRTNPIKDIMSLPVITGTPVYTLPSYVTKVLLAKRADDLPISERSLDELWNMSTKTGALLHYSSDYTTSTIRFYPVPNKDETVSLLIYRNPISLLSWASNTLSPELRDAYQVPMLNYAAYLCYMKDEANTLDSTRAASFLGLFDKEFPPTSVYSQIRKSRTSNRPIKFKGI